MAVTKEIKRLEKSNINLTITVPKDDIRLQYQDMMKEYTKSLQLPGFRKGKVPQEVLERKYADALKQDALGRIVESALQEVFKDENLSRSEKPLPYSTPELLDEPVLDLEQDLKFSVTYDVLPDIKIGQWKGLKIEHPFAEIAKEDIDRELEEIRERNAIVMDKDESASAKNGDVVTIDYQIFDEDGQASSNFQRSDFTFTLGSDVNIYNFDDEIAGMKKGETKDFNKEFPADFFEPSLAGSKRKIQVTLTSLKEKKLPDLDDDLAQDVDEKYNTLDDLKNNISERLKKNLERHLRDVKLSELLKEIIKNSPVVLPESMVNTEIEGRWRRFARYYNTSPEMIKQMMTSGEGHEERQKEWRKTAEQALHSRLIIETLIEEQNFEVTDDDVEKEFENIASENNTEAAEVKKHYDEQGVLYLKEEIKERRLVDLMFVENTLKPGKKEKYLDLMSDIR
ncbi:MAG: trigger factor [Treponema sp.]|nr:trigger factor [Treponema sp.]